jgi:hypothetical protein
METNHAYLPVHKLFYLRMQAVAQKLMLTIVSKQSSKVLVLAIEVNILL